MTGLFDKLIAPAAIIFAWVGSFEWRLRNKVNADHFKDSIGELRQQNIRMESHLWDIMKAQGVKPSRDVPEEVKNNGGHK